jgi:hypothetical protein
VWLAISLCLALAFAVGMVANRYVRPFATSEVQGVKLEALIGPVMSLTVLVLAFVLVQVFASFARARDSASDEARKVDFLYELGGYVPADVAGQDMRAASACYARTIAFLEWPDVGTGRTAPEASAWTGMLRAAYTELVEAGGEQPLPLILQTDKERGEARSRRLTEARPALPGLMSSLLLVASTAGVLALATFTLPNVRRRVQLGAIGTLTILLVLVQFTILDMDRPYDGLIVVNAVDMTRVAGDLGEDFAEDHPDAELPCDGEGRPLEA